MVLIMIKLFSDYLNTKVLKDIKEIVLPALTSPCSFSTSLVKYMSFMMIRNLTIHTNVFQKV